MIDSSKYVVLDVETNGLNSTRFDLLSISIYDPSTNKMYNRFLPLELNKYVFNIYNDASYYVVKHHKNTDNCVAIQRKSHVQINIVIHII